MFDQRVDPIRDPRRLAALKSLGLLDRAPEATFDRLTRLASKLLRVPVSLISLVDADRQFFKSGFGFPAPWSETRQTPLSHSFCQQVVIARKPLVVENARQHALLRTNGAVADLNVIAYLGVPLTFTGGEIIGALCAVDAVPRIWSDGDVRAFGDLAESVMSEIRLRAERVELLQAKARLSLQHATYLVLAEATSLDDAIGPLLKVVVDALDYDVGEFWAVDSTGSTLVRVAEWSPTRAGNEFSEASKAITFGPGQGLPGRVWEARKPIWLADILDGSFVRAPLVAAAGLKSGLGLPVMVDSHLFGVMTFLTRDDLGADEALRQVLTTMANQIGNFAVRRRTEAETARLSARLQGILEYSLDSLMILNHEGNVAEFNPAAEALFGVARAEAIGKPFGALVIPSERKADDDPRLREFFEHGEGPVVGKRIEALGVRSDGKRFPAELAISRVLIEGPPLFIASLRDISERKLSESRLLESEQRFRSSFDNAPIGMALVAPDGHWLQVNHALCEIIGYAETELLATDFQSITHPDDLASDLDEVRRLVGGEIRSYQMEKRYIHKRGYVVWVILSVSLVRDTRGQPLHFVSHVKDITPRKRDEEALRLANDELAKAKDAAEIASRVKGEFLANMSHEVRTPMSAVLGYADMLLDPQLSNAERKHAHQAIRRNGSHLLQIINDVLDLSKIEAGHLDLELINCSPRQVALEVVSSLKIHADEKQVALKIEVERPALGRESWTRRDSARS